MINIDVSKLITDEVSNYQLVIATAKRARQIAETAEENKEILVEKPVSLAINEIVNGKIAIK